jgi:hypothetical protein
MEADVDIENAPETALADNPLPPGDGRVPPERARWRQRPAARHAEAAHPPSEGDGAADAVAPSAPQRATRDIELWLLARRAQGAALRLDFELRTALVRQVFRRDFVYVSRQLHALDASRRVQGLAREDLDEALAALQRRADAVQTSIERQSSELQAAIRARGPASARISFACPARFQATIVSPAAHRFLGLLQQADEMLAWLEMAWLLGLVDPDQRTMQVRECRRALLDFKNLACERRQAIGQLVREANAQRKEGPCACNSPLKCPHDRDYRDALTQPTNQSATNE